MSVVLLSCGTTVHLPKFLFLFVNRILWYLFPGYMLKAKHAHTVIDSTSHQWTHYFRFWVHTLWTPSKRTKLYLLRLYLSLSIWWPHAVFLQGCDVPCHDGNVGPLGSAPGALSSHDHIRSGVQLWSIFCTATHRLHLPDFRLACCLLHMWWARRHSNTNVSRSWQMLRAKITTKKNEVRIVTCLIWQTYSWQI